MPEWETVIGLEIHVALLTKSKLFCGCSTEYGALPNTQTCPVCLGHPGGLPVLNEQAVEYSIKAGLALNCKINFNSKFDRKQYFYPDMAKNYQISQDDQPLCSQGHVDLEVEGKKKRIRIARAHLEEDAGKLTHEGDLVGAPSSLVDFNRCGVPLLEIVTEPDISSPAEARLFLNKLWNIIRYTGVSDCKMEEGSMRCDANISLRPQGSSELGTKTELKNLNSFRAVERGLAYEAQRQAQILAAGERVLQETRLWDVEAGVTRGMRTKEGAHDYRYFPEPNLPPLKLDASWIERVRQTMPELPDAREERFICELGLSSYDAGVLVAAREVANYFEEVLQHSAEAKAAANWVMGELLGRLRKDNLEIADCPVSPRHLAKLLALQEKGRISSKMAKGVFEEMFNTGKDPEDIVKEKGLAQITDVDALEAVVEKVLSAHPQSVEDYKGGKDRAFGFLVGQVMKETRGRANPQLVTKLLRERL
ncbi:MAG: Asp-tRNA(Asn)/Glu-tRNA(Gln) amidotransferase subunit GatB [Firmicutes bacterium]|nr:Asp-tRNA(Asn)/Glu-tRNA(Gln) amidotransferase subunit GatB [Bacillota bacterium]